jgi:uncharacterized protein
MVRLLIFILWLAILYFLWKLLFSSPRNRRNGDGDQKVIDTMVHDPNCNTYIPRTGALRKKIAGEAHYFCSRKCLEEYRQKAKS